MQELEIVIQETERIAREKGLRPTDFCKLAKVREASWSQWKNKKKSPLYENVYRVWVAVKKAKPKKRREGK